MSCWVQVEENSSKDGKGNFAFFVFFPLFQKIPRGSPDERERERDRERERAQAMLGLPRTK